MDIGSVKDYLTGIKDKYKEGMLRLDSQRNQERVLRGIENITSIRELLLEIDAKVEEGKDMIKGTARIMGSGDSLPTNADDASLRRLSDAYYGSQSFIKKIAIKVTGKSRPSLEEALSVIKDVTADIVPYVDKMSQELVKRRGELTQLRTELRGNVESYIDSREPMDLDIASLELKIKELDDHYKTVEQERAKNAAGMTSTSPEKLKELELLEMSLSELRETYNELKVKRKTIESNIGITNSQVEKVGDLLELLDKTQDAAYEAKEFVDVQVPYVLSEINAQQTQIQALTGINAAMQFLSEQAEVSREINSRISYAAGYLSEKIDVIRQKTLDDTTIYARLPEKAKEHGLCKGKEELALSLKGGTYQSQG